jgi:nitroreductase
MDLLPGLFSAGYFLLLRRGEPVPEERDAATIRAGCAVQRFWLTATRLGLALQANIGTLCFANYGRRNIEFSTARHALPQARRLAERFDRFCAEHDAAAEDVVFMGRLGTPRQVPLASRSIRRPLADLMVN